MFGTLGPQEILIIFLFILLLFGARRIPEFARALGRGIREFRKATTDLMEEIEEEGKHSKSTSSEEGKE